MMGPFPHDAPPARISAQNPAGTDGFEFVDRYGAKGSPYDAEFDWLRERDPKPKGVGFHYLDHLTHNVKRGNMDTWFAFYTKLFSFRQIRFFDIEGKRTGLFSRALTSPCGRIRIPINESADEHSQIDEYQ